MKSLIPTVLRQLKPTNPINIKSPTPSEVRTNQESKEPTIRNTKSTVVLDKVYLDYLKTKVICEAYQYKSLLISNGIKSKDEVNLVINYYKGQANKLLYGTPTVFSSEIEKNCHQLKENFLRFIHQQNYAEQHRDVNPLQRLINGSDDGFKVKRQDKSPYLKSPESIIPNNSKEELMGVSGSKIYENVISYFSKSMLDKEGRVIPVNATDLEIYTEQFPTKLANWVFAHVASLNKAFVKRGFEKNDSQEIRDAIKNEMKNELSDKEKKASPFTSASFDSPRKELFDQWGAAGEFVEIDLSNIQYLSPTYIVSLILFAADIPGADQKISYNWRDNNKDYWRDHSLQATEKLLVAHGIDPNGEWTYREKIAYYTLVADEYLIVGVTPPRTAKIVKTQSE